MLVLRRAGTGIGAQERDDSDVVDDAHVTKVVPEPQLSGPETVPVREAPESQPTRNPTDELGRIALRAGTAVVGFITEIARYFARAGGHASRAIEAVPPAARVLTVTGLLMLLGIVGAVALQNTLGLLCIVVVVPVCSIALGALGHRWYSDLNGAPVPRADYPTARTSSPDLQRSIEYVDKKLTVALNAFGAERQQHAMIALFQAKTAVELTLGTEQDAVSHIDALLSVEGHDARPRIRAGSAAKSLRENSSLQAS